MARSVSSILNDSTGEDLSLEELATAFLSVKSDQVKITTLVNVKNAINNNLLIYIDRKKKIIDLTNSDFEHLKKSIKTSPQNYNKIITYIKQVFDFAKNYFDIDIFPSRRLFKKRIAFSIGTITDDKKLEYYSFEQFKKLLRSIPNSKHIDRSIIMILFFLGLRIGEIRGLKWSDIENNRITIKRAITSKVGKGAIAIDPKSESSVRSFLLPSFISDELNQFKPRSQATGYIFKSKINQGDPIGETTIERLIKLYSSKANLPYLHPHGFRHSCATYLVNDLSLDLYEVSKWLGHANITITSRIYVHLFPSKKDEITKKIENEFLSHKKNK